MSSSLIKTINKLPTNIVNKIIPIEIIKKISFYNIPFSQDLSLSYQLYLQVNHVFCDEIIYFYENNPQSTANINKTKYNSLLRVCAMKRIITRLYNKRMRYKDSLFLQYRYDIMLESRFKYLGILYFPRYKCAHFNFFRFGFIETFKYIYHYIKSIENLIIIKFVK